MAERSWGFKSLHPHQPNLIQDPDRPSGAVFFYFPGIALVGAFPWGVWRTPRVGWKSQTISPAPRLGLPRKPPIDRTLRWRVLPLASGSRRWGLPALRGAAYAAAPF